MQRQLTITLNTATVQGLHDETYALYGFSAVRYGPRLAMARSFGGGYPLVWLRQTTYLENNIVTFDDAALSAYVSVTPLVENAVIQVGVTAPATLGQTVSVDDNGQFAALASGSPGVVSILNTGQTAWTCGLTQPIGDGPAPTCAFPLHGGGQDMIAPTTKILIMFAIDSIPQGAAVSTAYSNGFLIDFASEAQRAVTFDIDAGWSAGGATWARAIAPGTDLGSLLITS
jgi:hypothetical protein